MLTQMLNLTFPFYFLQLSNRRIILAFLSLTILAGLCLVMSCTRKYAILILGMLLYFQPFKTIGVLALAGIAYYFYRKHQKRGIA